MTTLYEKVGRRYVPVQDNAAYDGLPNGEWLITIDKGRRTAHRMIDTRAGFEAMAAVPEITGWIAELLREWSRTRPSRPLSTKEKRAWKAYTDIMGEDASLMLERGSAWDVAHEVARRIAKRANGEDVEVGNACGF